MWEYKEIYIYEKYKNTHKLQKKNSRDEQGHERIGSGRSTTDPRATVTQLWSLGSPSRFKLQDLDM